MSVGRNELRLHTVGDRRYFGWLTAMLALLVFSGFARTFYFFPIFRLPAPPTLLVVHGTLMTAWIALLAVQTALISARRIDWHKKVGIAGGFLSALILPLGCMATLTAAQREVRTHSVFVPSQLSVLGLELTQMALFAALVGMALWLRKQPSSHKRLMIVATLCIVPNSIVRLSLLTNIEILSKNIVLLSIWALLVIGVVTTDSLRVRRIDPAFGWSASIAIVALYGALYVGSTKAWTDYWVRLLG